MPSHLITCSVCPKIKASATSKRQGHGLSKQWENVSPALVVGLQRPDLAGQSLLAALEPGAAMPTFKSDPQCRLLP